jgi:hypothetical protein
MKEKYTPGEGCMCHAHSESECGCDVDWTPREVYELRETISDLETRHAATMLHTQSIVDEANELREQRDRLAEALTSIMPIFNFKYLSHEEKQKVRYASEVIAVVKGGNNE